MGGKTPVLVAKRLPPSNMTTPCFLTPTTETIESWDDGAMATTTNIENFRWPVCGGKWNQAYFCQPVATDNTDALISQVSNYNEPTWTNHRPGWSIGPEVTTGSFSETTRGTLQWREATTAYSQILATSQANNSKASTANIVPTQLANNQWPYYNFSPTTLTGLIPPVHRQPFAYPDWADEGARFHVNSNISNLFPGSEATVAKLQPVIEIEIPYYENTRFTIVDNYTNNIMATSAHAVMMLEEREKDST